MLSDYPNPARAAGSKIDRDGKTWAQKKFEVQRAVLNNTVSLQKAEQNASGDSSTKK